MNFKLQVRVKLKQALVNEISIFETIIGDWPCGRAVYTTDGENQDQTGTPHPDPCTQLMLVTAGDKIP